MTAKTRLVDVMDKDRKDGTIGWSKNKEDGRNEVP
jgi:hypothetical protein